MDLPRPDFGELMETVKIGPEHIDSFQLVKLPRAYLKDGPKYHECAMKGCKRTGRVRLYWSDRQQFPNQQSEYICVNHAFDLANEVLSKYKFGQDA